MVPELQSLFAGRSIDDLEPIDQELLSLIVANDIDTVLPKEVGDCDVKYVDDFTPLIRTSTPTAVDAYNPGFSKREVQDLLTMLAPEPLKIPKMVRCYSEPIQKIGKRTKKCTYAVRRKEVARLREESKLLERRLHQMSMNRMMSRQTREHAACEFYELAKSQEENERLRALVSSHEAKIRQADTYMAIVHQHQSV
ncbi:uncharacterized protein PHALS_03211 [Plasmopara halstedii]|uniref:Uncharacterized protein n=1 Tax=Plasmopara halstedii TaxID=4781 RepID=A0A0N7L7B5_PLAHL|nr:uncharacterized protein PHALS_03211 [Plasmopara halstedii]CEG46611.1 hypothetical protein PHALS_03211 [Plasmopara halstedii]|eukprot:XP_024582980.1 hypothetical protein PHALS_03211 [Plasmopara halstedii]